LRREARALVALAWPVVCTQLGMMAIGLTDIWMVGRLGARELAAVALGDTCLFGSLIVGFGLVMGIDPLVSQAHGAGEGPLAGRAFQRGVVVALLASLPLAAVWLNVDRILVLVGQDPGLAALAQTYATPQVYTLAPALLFGVLRQYLLGRGMMLPPLWIILGAIGINAVLNWSLVFGHLGLPRMGVQGAGTATAITRGLMMAGLAALIFLRGLHRDAWAPLNREVLAWAGLRQVLQIGLPIAVQLALEVWAFNTTTLFAGRMGTDTAAAHIIVLKIASTSFMFPLGISIASATRVGNLLGAGDRAGAQRAAWAAFALGAGIMALFAGLFLVIPGPLARLFNTDPEVVALAVSVFPVAAAFQVFDGTQIVGAGILRGMGTTRPAAVFNLLGYYLLALPLAWALGFHTRLALRGVWIGLSVGLAVVALLCVGWIAYRGPSRLGRLAIPSPR